MNALKMAIRQYRQFLPEAGIHRFHLNPASFECWLNDYVVPAIDEFWNRPEFQNQASWAVRSLCAGAATQQRESIDQLDSTFLATAKSLIRLASNKLVSRRLEARYSSNATVAEAESPDGSQMTDRIRNSFAIERSQIGAMVEPGKCSLMSVNDYFGPVPEFVEIDGKWIQRGDFITNLTPGLFPLGNLVVWLFLERARRKQRTVDSFYRKVMIAVADTSNQYVKQVADVNNARDMLSVQMAELRADFQLGRENRIREACMVLAQVYAALQSGADCSWIGLPEDVVRSGRQNLGYQLVAGVGVETQDLVSRSMLEIQNLYDGSDTHAAIDKAIGDGLLVVIPEWSRSTKFREVLAGKVWWKGQKVGADWSGTPFKLFHQLALKAKTKSYVTESDIYDDVVGSTAMSTAMDRLKKRLPDNFAKLIEPGPERATYKLTLAPAQIYVADSSRRTR